MHIPTSYQSYPLSLLVYSQVSQQGQSRNINITVPCRRPKASGKHPPMCYGKMDYICSTIVICSLTKIITLQTLARTICSITLHSVLMK